jgi:hypothetical protein
MNKKEIKTLVGNKFFTVDFIKKDGSLRVMNCRMGVTKALKGGEKTYNDDDFNYLTVFDVKVNAYRTINLDTIQRLKVNGETIIINKEV